jgi:hypothetical protein
VRSRACFHPDQGGPQNSRGHDELLPVELLPDQHVAVNTECHKVKVRPANINPNRVNLHLDDPPQLSLPKIALLLRENLAADHVINLVSDA